jgi:hypothetical protein
VGAAELANRLVKQLRLLEIAYMTGAGDYDELVSGISCWNW